MNYAFYLLCKLLAQFSLPRISYASYENKLKIVVTNFTGPQALDVKTLMVMVKY